MPASSIDPLPLNVQVSPLHENVNVAVGGASDGGALPKIEYSSRFGDPVPMLDSLLTLALLTSAAWTTFGGAAGSPERYSAATPATCGAAIDVPLIVLNVESLVYHADVMLEPG